VPPAALRQHPGRRPTSLSAVKSELATAAAGRGLYPSPPVTPAGAPSPMRKAGGGRSAGGRQLTRVLTPQ
jgi:hypothetical protein